MTLLRFPVRRALSLGREPLSEIVSRTPKIAEACTLACGHIHEHGLNDMPCDVRRHRCSDCAHGVSPVVEALAQEESNER